MNSKKQKTSASGKINTGFFLTPHIKKQNEIPLMKCITHKNNIWSDQLKSLLTRCGKYSNWLKVIDTNDGILTHEMSEHGLKSNNAHNMTQYVNPRIIPLGFVVAKVVHTLPNKSWSWHLWPIKHAINQPISKTLRATIFSYMTAANDD
jgi:hypothetical protein